MYGCESWTIKKAERWRIDAFELWCWRRLLRVPWTARRSNQSILKETSPNIHWKDWCWSWNSNTLAIWCKKLTHQKRPWCWKRLKAGEGDDRGWDGWMASLTGGHEFEWAPVVGDGQESLAYCSLWGCKESDKTEQLNWKKVRYLKLRNLVLTYFISKSGLTEIVLFICVLEPISCVFHILNSSGLPYWEWLQPIGYWSQGFFFLSTLASWNHWGLWHPCLLIWQETFQSSGTTR